jgi:hypothetical protein|tara:strand:- start:1002 stop:1469 length:468 start_codon:yes stop_codon:yes gene_type:complete
MEPNYFKFPILRNTFDKTSLDLTNQKPLGGPISDPASGFNQTYTPTNKYLGSKEGNIKNSNSNLQDSFKVTGLDVENTQARTKQGGQGGPNRTNSTNIPTGQYQNKRSSNMFGFKFSNANIDIKNKEGKVVTTQLQQYSPKASYMDSLRGKFFDI